VKALAGMSIRRQLLLLMIGVSALALVVAAAVSLGSEFGRARQALTQEMESLARLIGNRSSAALVFQDDRTAAQNLEALAGLPQVELACLLDAAGRPFARFAVGTQQACEPLGPLQRQLVRHDGLQVQVQMPVIEGDRLVGAVAMHAGQHLLRERLAVQLASLGAALALALAVAALLAWRLQRVISGPVMQMRAVADAIGGRGDASLRVPDLGANEVGELARAFNRMLDILRQRGDDLAEREAYSRRLFHESQVAQLVLEVQGRIVDCNAAAARLFGHEDRAALLGRLLGALRADEPGAGTAGAPGDALQGLRDVSGTSGAGVTWRMRREGGDAWDAGIDLVPLAAGGATLLHCIVQDVSALRAAEEARRAQQSAEAASQAKSQFLSRVSHELRTPLNAVLGFVQLLRRDAAERLDADARRHLDLAQQAGWHLLSLIEDMLDVARIEAGRIALQRAPVDLGPLLAGVAALCEGEAQRLGVRLSVPATAGPAPAPWVLADATRLRQVLLNLLSNAVKYNRRGGTAEVRVQADGQSVTLLVRDDGAGMSEQQQAALFEPFNRLGREAGPVAGTGLGLWLSRELVQLMGGRIAIRSAPGAGTVVEVTLAQAQPDGSAMAAPGRPSVIERAEADAEGEVLYVEDNPVNALLVTECLARHAGIRLRTAADGQAGLRAMRERMPHLLLLDMQLPDMSGLEFMARLRAEGLEQGCHVVALSASAMPQEVEDARRAGIERYWTKPIELARFARDVRSLLPGPQAGARVTAQASIGDTGA
jgi:PAS domain S-box-containing protein